MEEKLNAKQGFGPGKQEWGHVKVRENAHMFWWLYYVNPPETPSANFSVYDKPLLIWLQGGPGLSSQYGNFLLFGPIDLDGKVRDYSWVHEYNILFIDNPVGTGFSYVENESSYTTNNHQIAEDLVECIRGFLILNPKFADVPTYVTAESYGGKMAPEFALLWFKEQKNNLIKSNLKGVSIGNPVISPIVNLLQWAPFLFETGMVDRKGYMQIQKAASFVKIAGDEGKWADAQKFRLETEDVIRNLTNHIDFYNILSKRNPQNSENKLFPEYLTQAQEFKLLDNFINSKVKQALNIDVPFICKNLEVFNHLKSERMKPETHLIEKLLDETDLEVFVYNGNLDMVVTTASTLSWVEKLEWHGAKEWNEANREPLIVDNVIEGYVKEFKKFKVYSILRSGHLVPKDNPVAARAILKHLTSIK